MATIITPKAFTLAHTYDKDGRGFHETFHIDVIESLKKVLQAFEKRADYADAAMHLLESGDFSGDELLWLAACGMKALCQPPILMAHKMGMLKQFLHGQAPESEGKRAEKA